MFSQDPDEKESESVKVTPSLKALIEFEKRARPRASLGLVVDVCLRYGLANSHAAFEEWTRAGSERKARARRSPTPLRSVASPEPDPVEPQPRE